VPGNTFSKHGPLKIISVK